MTPVSHILSPSILRVSGEFAGRRQDSGPVPTNMADGASPHAHDTGRIGASRAPVRASHCQSARPGRITGLPGAALPCGPAADGATGPPPLPQMAPPFSVAAIEGRCCRRQGGWTRSLPRPMTAAVGVPSCRPDGTSSHVLAPGRVVETARSCWTRPSAKRWSGARGTDTDGSSGRQSAGDALRGRPGCPGEQYNDSL